MVRLKKICLDYGHRNHATNFGAINGEIKESELALEIGKKIKIQLEKNDIEVIETRQSEDDIISLNDRCKLANDNKVDLFLSVHINSFLNPLVCGVEVLHYQGALNRAKAQTMSDLIAEHTGARNRGSKQRNDLIVLRNTAMTALLIECGFMSNERELANLLDGEYQDKIVKGVIESLGLHYYEEEKQDVSPQTFYRVVVGSFANLDIAQERVRKLQEQGYKDTFIVAFERR